MGFSRKAFFWVLVGLLAWTGTAFAKESRGKITGINEKQNFILMQPLEVSEKPGQILLIKVADDTRWNGIKALKELAVGDEVTFEASKEKSGAWKLMTLSKTPGKVSPVTEVSSKGGGAAMAMGGYSGN